MTREQLARAIYENREPWSCPVPSNGTCPTRDCEECAMMQLMEYEAQIRAEAIDEFIKYFDEKSDFDIIHNDEYGEYEPSRYSLKDIFDNFLESQRTANLTIDKAEVIKEQKNE